jgi:uncharacterized protein (DUF362 family)
MKIFGSAVELADISRASSPNIYIRAIVKTGTINGPSGGVYA